MIYIYYIYYIYIIYIYYIYISYACAETQFGKPQMPRWRPWQGEWHKWALPEERGAALRGIPLFLFSC